MSVSALLKSIDEKIAAFPPTCDYHMRVRSAWVGVRAMVQAFAKFKEIDTVDVELAAAYLMAAANAMEEGLTEFQKKSK